MSKVILFGEDLEFFATVAWPFVTVDDLGDSMSCKDLLHVSDHTSSGHAVKK